MREASHFSRADTNGRSSTTRRAQIGRQASFAMGSRRPPVVRTAAMIWHTRMRVSAEAAPTREAHRPYHLPWTRLHVSRSVNRSEQ